LAFWFGFRIRPVNVGEFVFAQPALLMRHAALAISVLSVALGGCAELGALISSPDKPALPTPAALPDGEDRDMRAWPPALFSGDDYVVRILVDHVTCSGTLIDDDRVLTAHHCVTERNRHGQSIARDVNPERVRVELGGDYLPWGDVGVRAIVAPPCGHSIGRGDIAILVLERRLVGVATLTPGLDRTPALGQRVAPVGFGRCALSNDGIRRKKRLGGGISALSPDRFRLEAGICPGDSGGPALNARGDLEGIISASEMDGAEATVGESEFTRLDFWRPVFANAQLIAEGASPAELPPLDCPAAAEIP
jgi:hypothetical protein